MKNSNDTIGNRSRDLPVCSAVLQPLRHRVPRQGQSKTLIILLYQKFITHLKTEGCNLFLNNEMPFHNPNVHTNEIRDHIRSGFMNCIELSSCLFFPQNSFR
jgi:hypothetical protein